jgi:hypothetical protein
MSNYTRLIDNLRIRLPGALDGLIRLELFNVIDEFCRTTDANRREIQTTLTAGVNQYDIRPDDAEIVMALQVAHKTLSARGIVYDAGFIVVTDTPSAADVTEPLVTQVSVTPLYGNGDPELWLSEELYQKWFSWLLEGVLWRMMSQVAKPYSSERMALYHSRRFRNGMAIVRTQAGVENTPNASAWAFPAFA